ncbi:MAG: pyrroloquinoline quinone-dependent dehydrogenase [Bacteriovoracales bacterium]|nr:pyrroloquinoline quinone-dependent dehydrogenase [Bacteriovoracales bacterium]
MSAFFTTSLLFFISFSFFGCTTIIKGKEDRKSIEANARGSDAIIEWPYVGSKQTHNKYSESGDITVANVDELKLVWQWKPNEQYLKKYDTRPGPFQATPIMIQNVLYFSTMYARVVALDAETGTELWIFNPKAYKGGPKGVSPRGFKHRGIAYWSHGDEARIFLNSRDRLYAIDATTGKLDKGFGREGSVLLTKGHGRPLTRYEFDQTSPPVVFENLVIVGSRIPDRIQKKFDPPGTVQAYDVRTGKRRWVFFTIPQSRDDFGADTWKDESWRYTGHANVWGLMSLDTERGLLYVPTSTPSSDYWGGRRVGANLFADSLVCLNARTGKRQWHFQAVHHGVWDYDLAAAPNLVTITVDGRKIDAVAQVSKHGFTYVFDRVTGKPVWPIEERAVDTRTDVPGEVLYSTQPFPTKPLPFSKQGVSLKDANDLTPEIHALAVEEMKRFRLGPLFTPPSLRGTLQRPGSSGGANWGGAAFDPETGFLYVRTSEDADTNQVCLNSGNDTEVDVKYSNNCPYGATLVMFQEAGKTGAVKAPKSKLGPIPLIKPPYAHLVAIDLNKGEIAWKVPFGEGSPDLRKSLLLRGAKLPKRLGTHGNSGPMVTKGGLVFLGGGEPYLYAFNKATGAEVWRGATPFKTNANPMTYRTRSGRQFVVIATGAGSDAALAAFAHQK